MTSLMAIIIESAALYTASVVAFAGAYIAGGTPGDFLLDTVRSSSRMTGARYSMLIDSAQIVHVAAIAFNFLVIRGRIVSDNLQQKNVQLSNLEFRIASPAVESESDLERQIGVGIEAQSRAQARGSNSTSGALSLESAEREDEQEKVGATLGSGPVHVYV